MARLGGSRSATTPVRPVWADDPIATAWHFRDGWFITNVDTVPMPGKLRLLGRSDDVLTVGGIKQLPFPIEERLRGIDGVREAVVFGADGDTLGAIVELVAGTKLDPLLPAIAAILATAARRSSIRATDAMPRTAANKPDRRAAAALFALAGANFGIARNRLASIIIV